MLHSSELGGTRDFFSHFYYTFFYTFCFFYWFIGDIRDIRRQTKYLPGQFRQE